jgi:hypothetical protein
MISRSTVAVVALACASLVSAQLPDAEMQALNDLYVGAS